MRRRNVRGQSSPVFVTVWMVMTALTWTMALTFIEWADAFQIQFHPQRRRGARSNVSTIRQGLSKHPFRTFISSLSSPTTSAAASSWATTIAPSENTTHHRLASHDQDDDQNDAASESATGGTTLLPSPAPSRLATPSTTETPLVTAIASTRQLLDVMDDDCHPLVVIKYYASYCKICQRAGIQFKKIASEYPSDKVHFAKVESSVLAGDGRANHRADPAATATAADALRKLGVTKFPFVQIYNRGRCVASFSTGPSHMFVKKVRDTVALCLGRTPEAWDQFFDEFHDEIESNLNARRELRRMAEEEGRVTP